MSERFGTMIKSALEVVGGPRPVIIIAWGPIRSLAEVVLGVGRNLAHVRPWIMHVARMITGAGERIMRVRYLNRCAMPASVAGACALMERPFGIRSVARTIISATNQRAALWKMTIHVRSMPVYPARIILGARR